LACNYRVADQDAPQDAWMCFVRAPNEFAGCAVVERSSQEAWHAVALAHHVLEKIFVFITETSSSPSAAISG